MSIHPLVVQLRFTRSEFIRCLQGLSEEDARRRLDPMNCISWMLGHLANQESSYWVFRAQGRSLHAELRDLVGTGRPASTPPLAEMRAAWEEITAAADVYLDGLTSAVLETHLEYNGKVHPESVGTMLYRNIYHYWYHTGEASAVRQMLGHKHLAEFVGNIGETPYRREA